LLLIFTAEISGSGSGAGSENAEKSGFFLSWTSHRWLGNIDDDHSSREQFSKVMAEKQKDLVETPRAERGVARHSQ
jgi:hypothetical protein